VLFSERTRIHHVLAVTMHPGTVSRTMAMVGSKLHVFVPSLTRRATIFMVVHVSRIFMPNFLHHMSSVPISARICGNLPSTFSPQGFGLTMDMGTTTLWHSSSEVSPSSRSSCKGTDGMGGVSSSEVSPSSRSSFANDMVRKDKRLRGTAHARLSQHEYESVARCFQKSIFTKVRQSTIH